MTKLFLLFILVLVSIFQSFVDCEKPKFVIGGIFQSDQRYSGNYFVVNNPYKFVSPRKSYEIETKSVFVNDMKNKNEISKAVCELLMAGAQVLYGPTSCDTHHLIERLAIEHQVPYFTINDAHHMLNDTDPQPSNVIKMKPLLAKSTTDFIKYKNWTDVTFVYDGKEDLNLLKSILIDIDKQQLNINSTIKYFTSDQLKSIGSFLEKENIVFCITSESNRKDILKKIIENPKERKKNFFFVEISIENLVYLNQNPSKMAAISMYTMLDYKNLKLLRNNSDLMKSLKKTYPQSHSLYPEMNIIPYDVALTIDTLSLLQKTLDAYGIQTRPITQTSPICQRPSIQYIVPSEFKNNMTKINLTGNSGLLTLDEYGFRNQVILNLYEVTESLKLAKIGEWSSKSRLKMIESSSDELENQLGSELFEKKSPVVRVTTVLQDPFLSEVRTSSNSTPILQGFLKDLIAMLEIQTNLKFSIQLVKDGAYGRMDKQGRWNGMMGEILRGEADISVSPLTITYQRSKYVDFTVPFMQTGVSILYTKLDPKSSAPINLMKPFEQNIWICIFIAFIAVSLSLYLVKRFHPGRSYSPLERIFVRNHENNLNSSNQMNDGKEVCETEVIIESFWVSLRASLRQNGDVGSRCLASRLIEGSWWLLTLFLLVFYMINLSMYLCSKQVPAVSTYDDLLNLANSGRLNLGALKGGSTQQFLQTSRPESRIGKLMKATTSYSTTTAAEGVKKVRNGNGNFAFLMESVMIDYVNNRDPCNTIKVGSPLNNVGYGIAMKKGFRYGNLINSAILALKEKNWIIMKTNYWWVTKGECSDENTNKIERRRQDLCTLNLTNVASLTIFLAIGLVIGCLVIVFEFVLAARHESTKTKESLISCMKNLLLHKTKRDTGECASHCLNE